MDIQTKIDINNLKVEVYDLERILQFHYNKVQEMQKLIKDKENKIKEMEGKNNKEI